MHPKHILLAVSVAAIWGFNYVVIQIGLARMPVFTLCALRFLMAAVPAVFFVKFPRVSLKLMIAYGLATFALQLSLLFAGIQAGMPAGLSSLVLQVQVFFSIFFAAVFLNEKPMFSQILGALVAFTGMIVVALNTGGNLPIGGFILITAAAAAMGLGNLFAKKLGNANMISVVVWGCLLAFIPMFLLALIVEGKQAMITSITQIDWYMFTIICYIVYPTTLFAFGVWGWLLNQYKMATVAPFTLLVPAFGIVSAVLILDEPLQSWKIMAMILVVSGLAINLLGPYFSFRKLVSEA